jgi:hypothetical protein
MPLLPEHIHRHQRWRTLVYQHRRHRHLAVLYRYSRHHTRTPARQELCRITLGLPMVLWKNLWQQDMGREVQSRPRQLALPLERGMKLQGKNNSIIRIHRSAVSLHHCAIVAEWTLFLLISPALDPRHPFALRVTVQHCTLYP